MGYRPKPTTPKPSKPMGIHVGPAPGSKCERGCGCPADPAKLDVHDPLFDPDNDPLEAAFRELEAKVDETE